MLKPDKLRTSFLAVPPDRKETSPGAPDLASELAALKAAKGAAPAAPGLAGDLAALLAKKREKESQAREVAAAPLHTVKLVKQYVPIEKKWQRDSVQNSLLWQDPSWLSRASRFHSGF